MHVKKFISRGPGAADGIFIPAKLLQSFCIVSVLQEGGLGISFVVSLLTNYSKVMAP